jgi:hypothetical protein
VFFTQIKLPPRRPDEVQWSSVSYEGPERYPSDLRPTFVWETNRKELLAPFCLLTLILFGIGVAPWIRWSNRFTLRTLLIATTLVALVLGLIVWAGK